MRSASRVLEKDNAKIVAAFAADKKEDGLTALANLKDALSEFDKVLAAEDKQAVPDIQQKCLGFVGNAEEAMVTGFPFEVRSWLPVIAHSCVCSLVRVLTRAWE